MIRLGIKQRVKQILRKALGETSFRQQLATTFTFGVIVLALSASVVTSELTSQSLEDRLIEQGLQNTAVLAQQSVLGLLYESAENAQEFAETTLKSPDVLGVALYDVNRKALLEIGNVEFSAIELTAWPAEPTLVSETHSEWHYLAPVYSRTQTTEWSDSPFLLSAPEPELLGYVRVVMSKRSLQIMAGVILRGNFIALMLLAVLLLLLLLMTTRRLVKPLDDLSSIMLQAEGGDAYVRADIGGSKEIANMQHAFNSMMDVLENRETELVTARDMALESARVKGQFA